MRARHFTIIIYAKCRRNSFHVFTGQWAHVRRGSSVAAKREKTIQKRKTETKIFSLKCRCMWVGRLEVANPLPPASWTGHCFDCFDPGSNVTCRHLEAAHCMHIATYLALLWLKCFRSHWEFGRSWIFVVADERQAAFCDGCQSQQFALLSTSFGNFRAFASHHNYGKSSMRRTE